MKYLVAFVICIMLLFIPKVLLGVDTNSIGSADLALKADFSSSANSRCVVGFTNANVIDLYSTIKEESTLDLALASAKYAGTINMYYQMDNSKKVTVTLDIDTPFKYIDDSVVPATISFDAITITGYNKFTPTPKTISVVGGNSETIYLKPSQVMWSNGYTALSVSVDQADIDDELTRIGTDPLTATISLVTTAD